MYPDLHTHSLYSDGSETTRYLLTTAVAKGLSHLALTDHDCISGVRELWQHLPEAHDSASTPLLTVLAGVEISCDWNGLEIHVVGLLETPEAPALQTLLGEQQQRRVERMAAIDSKLAAAGITGLGSALAALPAAALTRSHATDFLVAQGHCKNKEKAFKSYLAKRGKAYVAAAWCSLSEAVKAIESAGGIAVLAHPSRYPLTRRKLAALLSDFKLAGGEAMEVSYANLDPNAKKRLLELAAEFDLMHSCGSDFHTAQASWTALGKFPKLEPSAIKNAIWQHPKWHLIEQAGRHVTEASLAKYPD